MKKICTLTLPGQVVHAKARSVMIINSKNASATLATDTSLAQAVVLEVASYVAIRHI